MQRLCRKCKGCFIPSEYQVKKSDFLCPKCRKEYFKKYRRKRKADNNPVISTKMPIEYFREYNKKYYANEKNRKRRNEQAKKYRNDPLLRMRHEARWQTARAIRSGKLIKGICEVCKTKKVEAHHDDYYKPLEVRWLCKKHHRQYHQKAKGE